MVTKALEGLPWGMDCLSFSLVLSFDGSIEKNLEKIDR